MIPKKNYPYEIFDAAIYQTVDLANIKNQNLLRYTYSVVIKWFLRFSIFEKTQFQIYVEELITTLNNQI